VNDKGRRRVRIQRELRLFVRTSRERWQGAVAWVKAIVERIAPTEAQRLFALTIATGIVCGFAAVGFHLAIRFMERVAIDRAYTAGDQWMFWTVATPVLGGLIAGLLLAYVVPNARGSGVPQVKVSFAARGGRIRFRDSIGKFFISSIQLGTGSSLGREGPTVQICGGLASSLGRVVGIAPDRLRQLLPVGVAAGIAAAFNAPIAAVTFTIEEVVGTLDPTLLSGIVVAAAFSAVIERSVLGEHPVFSVPQGYGLHHPSSLVFYAALGVAASLVSIAFTDSLLLLRKRFATMKKLPLWARPAAGALVTGVLAVLAVRFLGARGVTGGGYDTLGEALSGRLSVKVMIVLCLMKVVATVFSYSSGGAGGIFAPALFIGGMLGGAVGDLDIAVLDHPADARGAFALVGMGAVFSGIIRAPMTSVLIIFEMTGGYGLVLPLMIANMTSYALARHWRPMPIYEALLHQDGIDLHSGMNLDVLQELTVRQILVRDRPYVTFEPQTGAEEIIRRTDDTAWQEVFPVLGSKGEAVGIITNEEVRWMMRDSDANLIINAFDLMRPAITLRLDDSLRTAFEALLNNSVREACVVNDEGCVIGLIDETDIARTYLTFTGGDKEKKA